MATVLKSEPWPVAQDRLDDVLAGVPYGDLVVVDGPLGDEVQRAMSLYQVWYVQGETGDLLAPRATYQAAEAAMQSALAELRGQGARGRIAILHRDAQVEVASTDI